MKVVGRCGSERGQEPAVTVIFEGLDDNGLAQSVTLLDDLLQVAEDAPRRNQPARPVPAI